MIRLIGFLLILVPLSVYSETDIIRPFTTDGCSAFPDGTLAQKSIWANCCVRHDLAYWKGGTHKQRLQADEALAACVAEVGEPEIARMMLAGVRVGGGPWWPTPYRWGYGWSWLRGYKALDENEQNQVTRRLVELRELVNALLPAAQ